jgi:hypothetical protein
MQTWFIMFHYSFPARHRNSVRILVCVHVIIETITDKICYFEDIYLANHYILFVISSYYSTFCYLNSYNGVIYEDIYLPIHYIQFVNIGLVNILVVLFISSVSS